MFQKNSRVHTFWPQKEWRNSGRVKNRISWRESKKMQMKLAATCNKNENNMMPKIMLDCRPNRRRRLGRPLKRLLEEAETCLSGPNSWRMVMTIEGNQERFCELYACQNTDSDNTGHMGNVYASSNTLVTAVKFFYLKWKRFVVWK